MTVLRWLCMGLLRLLLGARYRLRLHGREQLASLKGPVLDPAQPPRLHRSVPAVCRALAVLAR